MNEYVRYENMRYEMAECAEVVRQVLGLTVPVSIKDLMSAMDKIGIQCISDNNLNTDTEIRVLPKNNPDYAFHVVYNAKINERNLIFAWLRQWVISCFIGLIVRNKHVQSVFAAADILRHFLYVKDILHIVYVKHKERKKENVK